MPAGAIVGALLPAAFYLRLGDDFVVAAVGLLAIGLGTEMGLLFILFRSRLERGALGTSLNRSVGLGRRLTRKLGLASAILGKGLSDLAILAMISGLGGLLTVLLYFTAGKLFLVASLSLLTTTVAAQIGLLVTNLPRGDEIGRVSAHQGDLYTNILERLAGDLNGTKPIIVGPWVTEIGFELLYWIPLLRKMLSDLGIPRSRVIALSRGGCDEWYSDIAGSYVDIFDLVGPDGFVAGMEEIEQEQGGKKLIETTSFERNLAALAARAKGLDDYTVIYCGTMYSLFRYVWASRQPARAFAPFLDIKPFDRFAFPRPEGFDVGPRYFTAKFYFSNCFTDTPEVRRFVRDKLLSLAEIAPVVLLNTGAKLDDHKEVPLTAHPNIIDGTRFYTPLNNLAVQSALVAGSEGLFCTYGGFSYLGPLLGVPTSAYYEVPEFLSSHFDLALRHLATPEAGLGLIPVSRALREGASSSSKHDADLDILSTLPA